MLAVSAWFLRRPFHIHPCGASSSAARLGRADILFRRVSDDFTVRMQARSGACMNSSKNLSPR